MKMIKRFNWNGHVLALGIIAGCYAFTVDNCTPFELAEADPKITVDRTGAVHIGSDVTVVELPYGAVAVHANGSWSVLV